MRPRTGIVALLIVILLGLQYRLWVGEGSFAHVDGLSSQAEIARNANIAKEQRNALLKAEIRELRKDNAALEEKARSELGLIKAGETFFLLVDDPNS